MELSGFCLKSIRSARIVIVPCVITTLPFSVPTRFSKSTSAGCSAEKLMGFSLSAFSAHAYGAAASTAHAHVMMPQSRREAQRRSRERGGSLMSLLEILRLESAGDARMELRRLALVVQVEPDGRDYSTRFADRHGPVRLGPL